ncbi:MAG TPA: hypothetical protein PKB12_11055 [Elusimicrobiota bacterium]|nr:hypothetical protein [Elusimicrobiota bacterium]
MPEPGTTVAAELEALKQIAEAFQSVDDETKIRILRWAIDKWGQPLNSPNQKARDIHQQPVSDSEIKASGVFKSVGELFAKANPDTDADKALVVSYWIQKYDGQNDIDSQRVNTELKHLGHGIPNITAAFRNLMARVPHPVIQIRKEGTSQQARKKFRLTVEGISAVENMLI